VQSDFVTIGPSAHTKFMGTTLDTWDKWFYVAVFSFLNTIVHEFVSDSLNPWIQNTLQDHKSRFLPYSKMTSQLILVTYTVYTHVTMLFAIFLSMSQLDFLIIRMVADIIVTTYSTHIFTSTKIYNPAAYAKEAGVPEFYFRTIDERNMSPAAWLIFGPCIKHMLTAQQKYNCDVEDPDGRVMMMEQKLYDDDSKAGHTPRKSRSKKCKSPRISKQKKQHESAPAAGECSTSTGTDDDDDDDVTFGTDCHMQDRKELDAFREDALYKINSALMYQQEDNTILIPVTLRQGPIRTQDPP